MSLVTAKDPTKRHRPHNTRGAKVRVGGATSTLPQRFLVPAYPHPAARHTWATLALSSGIHPKVVQERLGHSSISITMDRYSHAIDGMDRDAAETVAALIR